MHGNRNMVMRRGLNQSMMAIKNLGTIEGPNDLDFGQCHFVLLQGSEISNVS